MEYIIGILVGFMIGVYFTGKTVENAFDGEYDRAKYEWKLNKEKQNDNKTF